MRNELEDEEQGEIEIPFNELVSIVVKKISTEGYPKTIEWLLRRGVTPQDAGKLCEIATHIITHQSLDPDQQNSPRIIFPERDQQIGHRLGGITIEPIEPIDELYDTDELVDLYEDLTEEIPKYKELVVDKNLPQTKLRVSLIGGDQKTITLNLTHTIQELMEHIAILSNMSIGKFKLSTAFPRVAITVLEQTISTAKLENARIIQEKI